MGEGRHRRLFVPEGGMAGVKVRAGSKAGVGRGAVAEGM